MDKFEYKVKLDEIKNLISEGDFTGAAGVADSIDWNNVKNVRTLCMISDLYKKNRKFSDSLEVLLLAYNRQKTRPIVKSLCELSIELGDLIAAIEYFKEFVQIAPNDPNRYVLQYKIYKAQGVNLEEQIAVLEELKQNEYLEKWAYELAELYHRVGQGDKCVEECNELILWFVDGRYVIKAYELKALHKPLDEQETYKYELLRHAGGELNIQYSLRDDGTPEVNEKGELEVKNVDVSPYNTQNLQAVVAEGMQDIIDAKTQARNKVPMTREEAVALDEQAMAKKDTTEHTDEKDLLVTQVIDPLINEAPVGQELLEAPLKGEPEAEHSDIREVTFQTANTDGFSALTAGEESGAASPEKILEPVREPEKPAEKGNPLDDLNNTGVIEKFHKGTSMDEVLSQEYNGQISLVIPDEHPTEKQITGQISINDVMNEWEQKKREAEEKRIAEVKARTKKITKTLLADFDESTKNGLLAQIEDAMINAAIKDGPKQIKVSDIEKIDAGKQQPTSMTEEILQQAINEELGLTEQRKAEVEEEGVEELAEIEETTEETVAEETPEEIRVDDISEEEIPTEEVPEPETKDTEEISNEEEAETEEVPEPENTKSESEPKEEAEESEKSGETEPSSDEDRKEEVEEKTPDTPKNKKSKTGNTKKLNSEDVKTIAKAAEDVKAEEKPEHEEHRIRELSDSEKEQFAAFIHHKSTRRQLVEALDNVTLAAYTGNIIVSGEEETEVTAFSKLLIHEIQMSDSNFTGKVAKVSGENLNHKDLNQTIKTVANGALIIADAEKLKAKTVDALVTELQSIEFGLVIIIQGHSDTMDKIAARIKGFTDAFNLRIDLRAFDDKTLVEYAKTYAYDQEYSIDELGVLALHTRIADMQTADHEVTLAEIEEIMDEAIYYADRKTPTHFFDVLFGKRYDEEDMIVLREKDFMHY